MCKLLIVLGTKQPAKTRQFMEKMLEPMSVCNAHGAGYTAVRKDGTIFTERWKDNKEALRGDPKDSKDNKIAKKFGDLVELSKVPEDTYSFQGETNWSDVTSVIMHTRYATCDKTFDNVHPFVDDDNVTSIAHNGMISNHKEFKKLNSTCDSEIFLTEYNKRKIGANPAKIVDLVQDLQGYWALASTTLDNKGKRIVDIFTSNRHGSGSLVVAYIKELDGYVFTSASDNIKTAIKALKWDEDYTSHTVVPHVFARFDAVTGKTTELIKYGEKMDSYQVEPAKHGGHTRNHSSSKKKAKERRSLSQGAANKSCAYTGTKSTNRMGSSVSGVVGHVVSFYDKHNNKKTIVSKPSEYNTLSDQEQQAMDRWARGEEQTDADIMLAQQDLMDQHPSNFVSNKIKKTSDFDDKLSNFVEKIESSDSKYYKTILDEPLSEADLEELEKFSKTLDKDEQEILDGLPIDMRMGFLSTLEKEKVS